MESSLKVQQSKFSDKKWPKRTESRQQTFGGKFVVFQRTQAAKDSWRFISMLGSKRLPLWKQDVKRNDVKKTISDYSREEHKTSSIKNLMKRKTHWAVLSDEQWQVLLKSCNFLPITRASSSLAPSQVVMKQYSDCCWKTISPFSKFFCQLSSDIQFHFTLIFV